jgi:hypothetical protein
VPWFFVASVTTMSRSAPDIAGAAMDDTTRSGGRSSLTMVTVAAVVEPSVYAAFAVSVRITVSLLS